MPVTVVPTSFATVAIDTFITELSRVIRNCPVASVSSTIAAPLARAPGAAPATAPSAPVATCRAPARPPLGAQLFVLALLPSVVDVCDQEHDSEEADQPAEPTPPVRHQAEDQPDEHRRTDRAEGDPEDPQPEAGAELFFFGIRHVKPPLDRSEEPRLALGVLVVGDL